MNTIERKLQAFKLERQISRPRAGGIAQPQKPRARVIIGCITRSGLSANGKGSKVFVAPFCQELRRQGVASHICTSLPQIERLVDTSGDTILINVFGEDHYAITSQRMADAESIATVVFNRSDIGSVIADKQASLDHFTKFGVPMPPVPNSAGPTFSNARIGTGRSVEVIENAAHADPGRYNRAMINTVHEFEGRSYYTSVRLMCIADQIVHAMVRARPRDQEDPSVHSKDTPLDGPLLRYLQEELVRNRMDAYRHIARQMCEATGPCFIAHDILVESESKTASLCEAGFKFFDSTFQKHILPLRSELPFHAPLFDNTAYAQRAAKIFLNWLKLRRIGEREAI